MVGLGEAHSSGTSPHRRIGSDRSCSAAAPAHTDRQTAMESTDTTESRGDAHMTHGGGTAVHALREHVQPRRRARYVPLLAMAGCFVYADPWSAASAKPDVTGEQLATTRTTLVIGSASPAAQPALELRLGANQPLPVNDRGQLLSFRTIDASALDVFHQQRVVRAQSSAVSANDKSANAAYVAERNRLFFELQRLRAAAAAAVLRVPNSASPARLLHSETTVFFHARPPGDRAGAAVVVEQNYLAERQIEFPAGESRHRVGVVVDRRYESAATADHVAFYARPAASATNGTELPILQAALKPLKTGRALAVSYYDLPAGLVLPPSRQAALAWTWKGDTQRGPVFFTDFSTDFAAASGESHFHFFIAGDLAVSGREPRVTYRTIEVDDRASDVSEPWTEAPCARRSTIAWAGVVDGAGHTSPTGLTKSGWECQVIVGDIERPAPSLALVRVELPYPGYSAQ